MPPKWPQVNNGPENINEHATYLREACNQLQELDRGRKTQVPWNIVQPYLDSTIALVGKVLRQPALREVLQQIQDAARCTQNIQNDVKIIKNSVGLSTTAVNASNFGGKAAASWAQVAAQANSRHMAPPPQPHGSPNSKSQTPVTAYKDRVVTVKLKDHGVAQRYRSHPAAWTKQHVESSIKAHPETNSVKVIAAFQLKSGDIQVVTSTTNEATQLKENQAWLEGLGEQAELIVSTYGVIVHGISTNSINIKDQTATIQQLVADNSTVIPKAKISYIGWLTKEAHQKRASSIVVEFTDPEMANAIIYAGMVWDGQIHQCQLYDRACRVKQCFRCYNYGHIGTQCSASQVCGYCTEQHESKHCTRKAVEGFTPRCAVCKDAHTAWSNACPARKKELRRVEQAKETRSIYWHVPPKDKPSPPGTSDAHHVNSSTNDANTTNTIRTNTRRPRQIRNTTRLEDTTQEEPVRPTTENGNSTPSGQQQATQPAEGQPWPEAALAMESAAPISTVEAITTQSGHRRESTEQIDAATELPAALEETDTITAAVNPGGGLQGFSTQEADDWLQQIGFENDDWLDEIETQDPSPLTSLATDTRTAQGQIYKACSCPEHQDIYSNWPTHSADLTISRCMRTCPYCGKDFEAASELRKHMRKYAKHNISIIVEKRNRWGAATPAWTRRRRTESPPRRIATRITRSQSVTHSTSERQREW